MSFVDQLLTVARHGPLNNFSNGEQRLQNDWSSSEQVKAGFRQQRGSWRAFPFGKQFEIPFRDGCRRFDDLNNVTLTVSGRISVGKRLH